MLVHSFLLDVVTGHIPINSVMSHNDPTCHYSNGLRSNDQAYLLGVNLGFGEIIYMSGKK